jgi:hypothetical protein
VTVTLSDGRRIALSRSAGRRAITLPTLMRGLGARVTVMAVGPMGTPGPPAPHASRPSRRPDGCIRYLVTITVSGRNGARYVEMSSLTQLQPSIDLAKLKPGTEVHPMLASQRSRQAGCEKNSADPMRRSTTSSV